MRSQGAARQWSVALLGALASVLLHALLLAPFLVGTKHSRIRQVDALGVTAAGFQSSEEPLMTLMLIDETAAFRADDELMDESASRGVLPESLLVRIVGPEPNPPPQLEEEQGREEIQPATTQTDNAQSARALMLGRYIGQITARIERAWLRPRAAIDGGMFRCRVQILQDHIGKVQEVTVQQCNGDIHWQLSLVKAIESASPLPAPPDPSVFVQAVILELRSEAFVPGESGDGFEPEPGAIADIRALNDSR